MDGSGEVRLPQRHVTELSSFFAAHDRWLFGHAFLRTRGDSELAADLVQDTFEAAARAWTRLRRRGGTQQRAWLLGTLANKHISDFRRREAFRRKQPDILARYREGPPVRRLASDRFAQRHRKEGKAAFNAEAAQVGARPEVDMLTVTEARPHTPVMRIARPGSECGRGLQIVESLSVHRGWHREPRGKAVFAILTAEAGA